MEEKQSFLYEVSFDEGGADAKLQINNLSTGQILFCMLKLGVHLDQRLSEARIPSDEVQQ